MGASINGLFSRLQRQSCFSTLMGESLFHYTPRFSVRDFLILNTHEKPS